MSSTKASADESRVDLVGDAQGREPEVAVHKRRESIAEPALDGRRQPTAEEFLAMHRSREFSELRGTFRGFTIPVALVAFVWFLLYLCSATYFPSVMGIPFAGLNVGMWLGFAQFITAFAITWVYIRFANTKLEPRQQAIRQAMEG